MKKNILLFCIVFIYVISSAQEISFHHLTAIDGLSHNSVMGIYQDERGLMWFGTRNGVSLYNGKDFNIYKQDKDNKNSLLCNHVLNITGDKNGHIYILTLRGLTVYDIEQDCFIPLREGVRAQYIEAENGNFYVATDHTIDVYKDGYFEPYRIYPKKLGRISSFIVSNDSVLVSFDKQRVYLNTSEGDIQFILPVEASSIFKDSHGFCWIMDARGGTGCYTWHPQNGIKHYLYEEGCSSTLSSNFTQSCCEDKNGNIWIGTFKGLNKFDIKTGTFHRYIESEYTEGLTHSSVWSLYCDTQGTVWAGTYFGGINYFNEEKQIYKEHYLPEMGDNSLVSPILGRIVEDNFSNLWVCTEGNGLYKLNSFGQFQKRFLTNSQPFALSHNNIKSIYYDSLHATLWLGTHMGGLNKFDMDTERFVHYKHCKDDSTSIPSDIISDIIPFNENLLLATHAGIGVFNPKTQKCQLLLSSLQARRETQSVLGLLLDKNNRLWIINNNNGVASYNFRTKSFHWYSHVSGQVNSISSNAVNSVYMDSRNRLWFSTNDSGFDLYCSDTDNFRNFDVRKNGLSSNVVYNICELVPDTLLITTDKGISIFDCISEKVRNIDDIPLDYINENSLFVSRRGEIFIGGVNKLVSFVPSNLKKKVRNYRITPFRLLVNGEEVRVGDDNGILLKSLAYTNEITLSSVQNAFTLEFAVTDYIPYNKDEIMFRLEGFSDKWTNIGEKREISFTNLDAGQYTLVIKASGKNENKVSPYVLKINVLPPFYLTKYAYGVYLVSFLVIVYLLIYIYRNRIRLQESLKYEKKRAEDLEKLNQIKLQFFTSVSHEFRTPLTLIAGQIDLLLQNHSLLPAAYNKVLSIYKNCQQLKELITELLDFRKQEQGFMSIKVHEHNLVNFVYEHYLLFEEYARQKKIVFTFTKSDSDIRVWYDAKQMHKVINNLMSNAFNYTKEGGTIAVSVEKSEGKALIVISDTGMGIAPEYQAKIFERFYQVEGTLSGTGIGLALTKGIIELHHGKIEVSSKLNEGTTFRVSLLTGNTHFSHDQIIQDGKMNISWETDVDGERIVPFSLQKESIDLVGGNNYSKFKVLIVEDNPDLRDMLVEVFSTFYQVLVASNGKEGLKLINEDVPDIIVCDIVMPEMSGTELCQTIKKDPDFCHIPVVLLTARTSVVNELEGFRLGADDYITKPFDVNVLLSRCHNLINSRIRLQEKFSNTFQPEAQMLATNAMDKEFIDKIVEVIEKWIDNEDFNVDCLAEEIGYSRSKLFRKMKGVTGQTPADFIMTFRLQKAAVMLKQYPECNISEISDRLGFASSKYFSRCFKNKFHVSPLSYRRGDT